MFEFYAPTHIMSADSSADGLAQVLATERPARLAVFVDRGVSGISGVEQLLSRAQAQCPGTTVMEIEGLEPTTDMVDEHAAPLREERPSLVVGVGGGSVLDLAKAVCGVAFNPGTAADYQGRNLLRSPGCANVMIPTTAGTGSEVTPGAVVFNPLTKRKGAIWSPHIIPRYAILDPALTVSMPPSIAAATGIDALSHAVESFTARCATPISRMYSREAFRLISASLPGILAGSDDIALRRDQQLGATLAGIAICNADTGAAHSLGYAMGIYFGVPHGVSVALSMPHVMEVNIRKGARHYAELADVVPGSGRSASAESKCWRLQEFVAGLASNGRLPTLRSYGVQPSDVPALAQRGLELKTALGNNPVGFTLEDARYVLERLMDVDHARV